MLETRADNVVYRSGLASTRRGARQMVSHGHIKVNGTRTMVPSHELRKNDVISVRDGSKGKSMFAVLAEKNPEGRAVPQWIDIDVNLLTVKVTGEPSYSPIEAGYDYATVFEFYSR